MPSYDEGLYDPPENSGGQGSQGGKVNTQDVQRDLDEATGAMRDNIDQLNVRGDRMDALQDKTDTLAVSAQGFRRGANKVRKKMWWKDMKMRLFIIGGIAVIVIIIVVSVVVSKNK